MWPGAAVHRLKNLADKEIVVRLESERFEQRGEILLRAVMLYCGHIVHLLDRGVDSLLDQQLQPVAYAGCRLLSPVDIAWPIEDALDDRKDSGPLENRSRETEGSDEIDYSSTSTINL